MERIGFRFSSKTSNRYWRGLFSAVFLFVMFLIPTVSNVQQNGPTGEKFFVLLLVLLVIASAVAIFGVMLIRIKTEKFVLEFTATEMIDRRFLRLTRIPYADVEIFSPTLDRIFAPNPKLREIQNELEIGDHMMITCRLKDSRKALGPAIKGREYFFSEAVAQPDLADRRLEEVMRSGLEGTGVQFENLYEVDDV